MMRPGVKRSSRAYAISEFGASIVLIVPIVLLLGYAAVEAGIALTIQNSLNTSASLAARKLAISYAQNPALAIASPQLVFDQIRFTNIVNNSEQFAVSSWNTGSSPPTVTVTCSYMGGQSGRPVFPNPDPLNLGAGFKLKSQATCQLE